jgi:hypothetical protein
MASLNKRILLKWFIGLVALGLLVAAAIFIVSKLQLKGTPHEFALPVVGSYLRTDYIEKLIETRSPLKAETELNGPTMFRVESELESGGAIKEDRQGVFLTEIFNFHEGGASMQLFADGTIKPVTNVESIKNLQLESASRSTFTISYREDSEIWRGLKFEHVGDVYKFVAAKTVAGRYLDDAGKEYQFTENGEALFPDGKHAYEVGIDHVLNSYDYLNLDRPEAIFAFQLGSDGGLQLFETSGENSEIIATTAKWVLRRVK